MAILEGLLQLPSTVPLLVTVLLLLFVYLYSSGTNNPEKGKEPPGPRPLPILGNLLQLDLKRPYETLCKFSKTYGSVFTVYFGPEKIVVLSGYKTVKEALVSHAEEFGDRAVIPIFHDLNKGHGIIFSNGDKWKEMRRFALTNLRDFGMGKKGSEEKIIEETHYLSEVFESFKGEAFDTTQPVNYAVSNIISAIVYGSRFDYNDSRFIEMVQRANEAIRLGGTPTIHLYNMFPWLGPLLTNCRKMKSLFQVHIGEMKKLIDELQETLNPLEQRGFVDCFLMQKKKEESGQKDTYFHQDNMVFSVANLFAAGTDTTGTTVRWALLLMAKYPHIQDRVQKEIDQVIGGRQPVVEDRKNLPYTDAVIHETQRLANIVPMSIPHTTSCDVHFQGLFIKKGTTVFPLLTSVLRDELEWAKPYDFYPEHFLDDQGQFLKRDAFMPFSAGRRVCLGESLARMELFLFFTTLLQRFRFTPSPGVSEDELDLTPAVGFTLNPLPHKLCAVTRS